MNFWTVTYPRNLKKVTFKPQVQGKNMKQTHRIRRYPYLPRLAWGEKNLKF